jgi:hypothetical protein
MFRAESPSAAKYCSDDAYRHISSPSDSSAAAIDAPILSNANSAAASFAPK